jgi:ubiquinone/menaquinone biosynthesis C-methylase UbiE
MRINNNTWNKIRYTLYLPIYDIIVLFLKKSRKRSIKALNIQPGEKVLIIGAGTGLDLEFMPLHCEVIATDITPAMVEIIRLRNTKLDLHLITQVMDGQALNFSNQSFDVVILHLILAVIPDPVACLKEAERVLKPGGRITVFDKFVRPHQKASFFRRCFNVLTNIFFTDITRSFETLVQQTSLTIVSDEDANLNGNFRIIQMRKG